MSAYLDILNGVRQRLDALQLNVPVKVRKKLVRLPNDPTPMILVAPGKGGEALAGQTFGRRTFWDYPVAVAYVTAGNQQLEQGLEGYLDTREAIRDELLQANIPGVDKVFRAAVDPEDVAQLQAAVGTNFDVTGVLVVYRAQEQRKG